MKIIDAQVHIWQADTPERPHIKEDASKPHQPIPLTYERLLAEMAGAGVDRAILVPPSWDGYRNDYALEAAQKYPDRFAVMGKVPLNDPASKDRLPTWLKQPGMKGFRISFRHSGTHSFLDDGTADWFWADCERYDIPVMIFAPFAVAAIGKIAERHPGLRVIVDHMGLNVQWRGKDLTPGVDLLAHLRPPAQRRGQSFLPALLRRRELSISHPASADSPGRRCVWPATHHVGHRPFAVAGYLPAKRHAVHRGVRVSFGERQRMDHGQESRALAALACLARRELDRTSLQANGDRICQRAGDSASVIAAQAGIQGLPAFANCRRIDDLFSYLVILSLIITSSCATVETSPISARRPSTVELSSCNLPKHKEAALCGKHQVYENRSAKSGRVIALNLVVLPALSSEPKAEPVFYLAGGPGQGAARIAGAGEDAIMRELRRERDLVFVDMRGTGDSNGLQCDFPIDRRHVQSLFGELFDPAVIQLCREKLERIADLKFYNSSLGIDDLDDIRLALGYDKINLYGISHGSQAALEYLRRYPDHVRSAVLTGVATPAMKIPLQFARGADQAMAKLFNDCAGDESCNAAFPNLQAKFAQLLRSFDSGTINFQVLHPSKQSHAISHAGTRRFRRPPFDLCSTATARSACYP